jgi:hypothetical protein
MANALQRAVQWIIDDAEYKAPEQAGQAQQRALQALEAAQLAQVAAGAGSVSGDGIVHRF